MGLQGYGDYKELVDNLNSFLAPFDIKLLFENVKDEKHKEVFKGILNYVYYKTANILNQHPVTAGIKYIWYPGGGGQHASPISTYTFKASSSWEILIRGEKTAFSPSYPSEPPLLACRDFGKGRIAFLSMDARYFINDGYHPAYGGYAMEKGDGFRLLLQIYNWLAEPSLKQGRIFSHFSLPSQQPTKAVKEEKPPEDATCGELIRKINDVQLLKTFKGVIGVHSDLSDGENCVEELCVEAKRLGLDFLVFTERYDLMNEIKWNELVRRCKAQSTNSFIAIPGLKLTTPDAEIICFHLSRFPKVDEVTNPPALLFNLNFPTIVICKPHLNHLNPWQYKFYTGIALFTYEKGSLLDEATSLYRELSANDYRLIPVAVNYCYSLSQLEHAVREEVITYVSAEKIEDLIAHPDWQHSGPLRTVYGEGTSYVSSGLVLNVFAVATKESLLSSFGAYAVFPGHKELFKIELTSQYPIRKVIVYRGTREWRKFFPGKKKFSQLLWATSIRDDEPLMVYAEDINGRILFSNSLRKPYNPFFSYTMCVDKQNSIVERAGIGWSAGWIAGLDVGAIFPLIPANELVPAGEDASWCPISSWETRPILPISEAEFRILQGNPSSWNGWDILTLKKRYCSFSSPDCIVIDNYYEKKFLRGKARYIYFRPFLHGINAIYVEGEVEVLRNIPYNGDSLIVFRIMTNTATNPYEKYAAFTNNNLKMGSFRIADNGDDITVALKANLRKGDWLSLFPSILGNIAVYSLSALDLKGFIGLTKDSLHAFVSGANEWRNYITLAIPLSFSGKVIPPKTKWSYSFLFILDNSFPNAPFNFSRLQKIYGIGCKLPYAIEVKRGKVLSSCYFLHLEAEDYGAILKFSHSELPFGLGIKLSGLNPNWEAGLYTSKGKEIKRIGIADDGAGYCHL
ncbi:MAG: hypothetical protein ACP5QS_05350, partial [bacterium]